MNKRIICICCVALIFVISFLYAAGCQKNGDGTVKNPVSVPQTEAYNGVHIDNSTPTDEYIVRNNVTDYQIVIPDDYERSAYMWTAASELSLFLAQSSGADFSIVTESRRTDGKNYISLGGTAIAATDVASTDVKLGKNGYRLVTAGKNIYIAGSDIGVLNGVYGLLRKLVGFEVYAPDETKLSLGDIKLVNLDVTEVPDIEYRVGDVDRRIDGDEAYRRRLGYNCTDDVFLYVKGTLYHNSLYYFDEVLNNGDYSDWFNTNKTQLCYTA
uniref:hypothetical protein n=1 Tax=Candidatus Fimenecus sp. TaxID=3022888 RepID=UPI004025E5ED